MTLTTNAGITIENALIVEARIEAGCTGPEIIKRLEAMYRANLHEDLKWVIEDILEVGV